MHMRTYNSWGKMKQRCLNPNHHKYLLYGARGIKVCKRWMEYRNFLEDMGERPANKTLDRINVNGNYELSNCRWASLGTQQRNRRGRGSSEYCGVSHCGDRWRAYISVAGKRKHIGVYDTQYEAYEARMVEERKVGYS